MACLWIRLLSSKVGKSSLIICHDMSHSSITCSGRCGMRTAILPNQRGQRQLCSFEIPASDGCGITRNRTRHISDKNYLGLRTDQRAAGVVKHFSQGLQAGHGLINLTESGNINETFSSEEPKNVPPVPSPVFSRAAFICINCPKLFA